MRNRLQEIITLVMPREHGSWSLALEPVAFGLIAAPSRAGIPLAIAAAIAFLMRRPLKILLQPRADPRRSLALGCLTVMVALAGGGLLLSANMGGFTALWPLIPAAVAGMFFVWSDLRGEWREGMAEISGSIAFAILPAVFGLLAKWPVEFALALAAMMLARSVPTVIFVRSCLHRIKGRKSTATAAVLSAVAAAGLMGWLASRGLAPWTAAGVAILLLARVIWFLQLQQKLPAPRTLGFVELGAGIILIAAVSWAWHYLPR